MDPELTKIILGGMATLQAITIAIAGMVLKQGHTIRTASIATKEQIVNDHPKQPNFREENDRRHAETRGWFTLLLRKVTTLERQQESHGATLDELMTGFLENRERIESIEDTAKGERK